ncbi:MAG: ribulose-phosphate 3-epimerase [Acidobacteria bacterium]|nr:ribulose-phosphate 3-epimerase [Acidobacteriota bacterium]
MVEILPSLLAADFARLGEEIARVEHAGVTMLHVDVMDGHFVPNLSMGPPVVKSLRRVTKAHLDVHLMITDPDRFAAAFVEAGADSVSVHQEACPHLDRSLRLIQSEGALAGVVLNPATPVSTLDEVLEFVDFVLVMSVNPGFGGQRFLPRSLEKIRQLAERRERFGYGFKIEIDGGVVLENVAEIARAGAEWLVAGSSVFGAPDSGAAVRALRDAARAGQLA